VHAVSGRVVLLAGSPSDDPWAERIVKALDEFPVQVIRRIGSAHRVPEHVLEILRGYDNDDVPTVFITIAGMSDALSGLADANVASPVIACPPRSDQFGSLDVLSSLRTPPGVAPLVALEPANAALAAAKILGLVNADVRTTVVTNQTQRAKRVLEADSAIIT
jgi:5-(carboxyamino)imidazole ribonucleotide mutase